MAIERFVRIRSYKAPLKNCTLLTISSEQGQLRILTGCGLGFGKTANDSDVLEAVAALVGDLSISSTEVTGPSLTAISVAHSGKSLTGAFAAPGWSGAAIDEVWFPSSEGPGDDARSKRESFVQSVSNLTQSLTYLGSHDATVAAQAIADSCSRDAKAMETLSSGFATTPRILYFDTSLSAVAVGPDGTESTVDLPSSFGPMTVRSCVFTTKPGPSNRPDSASWRNPRQESSGLRPFDGRFRVEQLDFTNRNLQLPESERMNLRNIGRVVATSRVQPIALALSVQKRLHATGFGVRVSSDAVNIVLAGSNSSAALRQQLVSSRSLNVLIGTSNDRVPPGWFDVVARTDVGKISNIGPESNGTITEDQRWTEITIPTR